MKWESDKINLKASQSLTKDNSGANLWVFLTGLPDPKGPIGWAPIATVCDTDTDRRNSINAIHGGILGTSMTVAHEVGHNLGMAHDFVKKNNPRYFKGESCDHKGLMSYGSKPHVWSKCSRNDLMAIYNFYLSYGSDKWCLESKHFYV